MDILTPILTGLFSGIGVGVASWLTNRKINVVLDHIDTKLKNVVKREQKRKNAKK